MKASVFVGTSLDGFLARADGRLDFLPDDGGEPHGYDEFMATVDALVLGRNTFDIVLKFPTWPYGEKPVFVLSRRALPPVPPGAVVERRAASRPISRPCSPPRHRSRLRGRRNHHSALPSRRAHSAHRRHARPVLIGSGIPLFGALSRDVLLKHVATRSYASGLVQSEYDVVG